LSKLNRDYLTVRFNIKQFVITRGNENNGFIIIEGTVLNTDGNLRVELNNRRKYKRSTVTNRQTLLTPETLQRSCSIEICSDTKVSTKDEAIFKKDVRSKWP